ncbi:MAG: SIS domain-containing protein [Sphingobacteriales bacterium]|jgi:D-sedoheptulose 7-phosphate isomerase|nr:SIS domain-containing protein [Sphingobacteriales bacterium]MDA0198113.1 SIS domain-containing protein [Bacteroidota bacterium]MBK6890147.1 SIS domain-containing protein [Sphingobacteriales bacterium]MBK7527327.1 SIS domain-containing protein [Sphingobacteriales bacterium]MBK8678325.1 SIS domain-containing protein [Sphingobacteriales bacterium]
MPNANFYLPAIKQTVGQSLKVFELVYNDDLLLTTASQVVQTIVTAYKQHHARVWFCGNGGSAAQAQHLAAELSGRFNFNRPPLFAESFTVNTSYITAVANDYGYDHIFSRLVEGFGQPKDVLMAFSTSGNSPNIIQAVQKANEMGVVTIGFTGHGGGKMAQLCQYLLNVPSNNTPQIQEAHLLLGHIICGLVEEEIFANLKPGT